MKKVLLALLAVTLFNCEDECIEEYNVVEVSGLRITNQNVRMNTSLTGNTTFEGDTTFNGGLNLNGYTATVTGDVRVNGNLNGGGSLIYCGSFIVTGRTQNFPDISEDCGYTASSPQLIRPGVVAAECGLQYGNRFIIDNIVYEIRY